MSFEQTSISECKGNLASSLDQEQQNKLEKHYRIKSTCFKYVPTYIFILLFIRFITSFIIEFVPDHSFMSNHIHEIYIFVNMIRHK